MIMTHKGLTPNTAEVFDKISTMKCINGLVLCGGTALSLQIGHRLSEDLDFELIGTRKDRPELDYNKIVNEVKTEFPSAELEFLGDDHFQIFLPGNVKLSFFRPEHSVPYFNEGFKYNNLVTPSLQDLLGMKIYTTTVRNVFRDYYDIYCLLEQGCNLKEGVDYALKFSRHTVHTKTVLTTLTTPQFFRKETNFDQRLEPQYEITSEEICEKIKEEIKKLNLLSKKKEQQKQTSIKIH